MRPTEPYWAFKGPPIPEVADLPPGAAHCDERAWCSLSPGMRREIWRDALRREAQRRQLSDDMVSRVRIATVSGRLGTLDEYLEEFAHADAARPALREDTERLQRADLSHQKSETQIAARETP